MKGWISPMARAPMMSPTRKPMTSFAGRAAHFAYVWLTHVKRESRAQRTAATGIVSVIARASPGSVALLSIAAAHGSQGSRAAISRFALHLRFRTRFDDQLVHPLRIRRFRQMVVEPRGERPASILLLSQSGKRYQFRPRVIALAERARPFVAGRARHADVEHRDVRREAHAL